jgi:hypothetical protein
MYYAIGRLDASQFVTLDFTLNFGISSEVRAAFVEAMQNGGDFDSIVKSLFEGSDMLMLLKLHRYLNWADKKLHSVFFLENKDQINEDLLSDFKEDSSGQVVRHGANT